MPYATQSDAIAQFGEREIIALTDRENAGVIDGALLDSALLDASAEVDTYMVGRYLVPLSVVSRLVVTYTCDIARYRLSGATVTEIDTVRNRYKDAIRFLESVRDGKTDLGVDVVPASDASTQNLVFFTESSKVFSRGGRGC